MPAAAAAAALDLLRVTGASGVGVAGLLSARRVALVLRLLLSFSAALPAGVSLAAVCCCCGRLAWLLGFRDVAGSCCCWAAAPLGADATGNRSRGSGVERAVWSMVG